MPRNQIWGQYFPTVIGAAEAGDQFGNALVSGDFDNDGRDDLAIGVSNEDVGSRTNAGAVNLLYGTQSGLTDTRDQIWTQNSPGIESPSESFDGFGNALTSADFDGDGRDDLAIGVPFEDGGTIENSGAVNVIYGTSTGLSASGSQIWEQRDDGIESDSEAGDLFGYGLSAGDFDGDGRDDLAVGVLGEDGGTIENSGAVNVIYGTSRGLSASGSQIWEQGRRGLAGSLEAGDAFGSSLTVGDFDGDGRDDLAVGAEGESIAGNTNAGSVNVLYGSVIGLTAIDDQFWTQNSTGVLGFSETNDQFGKALAAGDFDGDGRDDLAVGVEGEAIGNVNRAGAVNVLYGTNRGLTAVNDDLWHRNSAGITGVAASNDLFGTSLGVGDFNNDGYEDLAIGASGADFGRNNSAGAVHVLYGSSQGLRSIGEQVWYQQDLSGSSEAGDRFGASLGVGDHNGDGIADLAIGVPGEDIRLSNGANLRDVGAVNVLYGSTGGGLTA